MTALKREAIQLVEQIRDNETAFTFKMIVFLDLDKMLIPIVPNCTMIKNEQGREVKNMIVLIN